MSTKRHGIVYLAIVWAVTLASALMLMLSAHGGRLDPCVYGPVPALALLGLPLVAAGWGIWLLALALMRHWRAAGVMIASMAVACVPVSRLCPLNISRGQVVDSDSTFTVMTFNVAAFPRLYEGDTSAVMRTILDLNPDVAVIQEMMHADRPFHYDEVAAIKDYIPLLNQQFPYRSYPYKDDVAILSKYPFTIDTIVPPQHGYDALNVYSDLDHYESLAFDIEVNGHPVRLIGTHLRSYGLSNADKRMLGSHTDEHSDVAHGSRVDGMSLWSKLRRAFALRTREADEVRDAIDLGPQTVIVCGDFNDVTDSYCYRLIAGGDMHDAWQQCGRGYVPTYSRFPLWFRIDHMLYRGDIQAIDCTIHTDVVQTHTSSDHYPMVTTFEFTH